MHDLFRELGIGGSDTLRIESQGAQAGPQGPQAGPHALVLDQWGIRRGEDLALACSELRAALPGHDGPSLAAAAADMHGLVYEPAPQVAEACLDATRHEYAQSVQSTPEYAALHQACQGNDLAAEIGAIALAQGLGKAKARQKQNQPKPTDRPAVAAAKMARAQMACKAAAAAAVKDAIEQVDEAGNVAAGFGLGDGQGGTVSQEQLRRKLALVKGSYMLRQIFEMAGRLRQLARAKQASKATHGRDEIVGVEVGGDVSRLIPTELAALGDEDLELDMLRRIVERQALQWAMTAEEKTAKGPVMVFVDCSGSMDGDRLHAAKALALTLAWVAKQQRRWCCLVNFSSSIHVTTLPPGGWDESKLVEALLWNPRGGTDLPLHHARLERLFQDTGAPRGKTDLVIITDGIWAFQGTDADRAETKAWLAAQPAQVISLVIAAQAGELGQFGEVHLLPTLDGNAAASPAVGAALSI